MPATAQISEQEKEIGGVHTRFNRQVDFVPYGSLEGKDINVIGCGAIGRQVALQLAAIGVRRITLVDFDVVSPTNVTTQGFLASDVGESKVHAVERSIKAIDPAIEVIPIPERFKPDHKLKGIVFICVDSIEARESIWNRLKDKAEAIIDSRMLGEIWRVIACNDDESRKHFQTTLFPANETAPGRCTGHATIYSASMPASWAVHQLTKHLRGIPLEQDMMMNMFAGEFGPIS